MILKASSIPASWESIADKVPLFVGNTGAKGAFRLITRAVDDLTSAPLPASASVMVDSHVAALSSGNADSVWSDRQWAANRAPAIKDAPPGNEYGAVPPPANDEDEPGPSAPSKRGMGAMD